MVSYKYCSILRPVPNRYPNPSRYPIFLSIPHPTRFSFENHRVAGNTKYRIIIDIQGYPKHLVLNLIFRVFPDVCLSRPNWVFQVLHHDSLG